MKYICGKHGLTEFSEGVRPRCRKCMVIAVTKRRRQVKKMAVDYLGGKCQRCGYDKCVDALDFHHKDPSKKDFNLGKGNTMKWQKVVEELDKCELLCANCHREEHSKNHKKQSSVALTAQSS